MFDIGFTELLVIGVVALVVIGPERLPRVARTVGILMGRMQRYVADVKADINREIELDELRKMRDSVQSTAGDIQSSIENELRDTEQTINAALASPGNPEPPVPPEERHIGGVPSPAGEPHAGPAAGATQPDPVPK